MSNPVHPIVGPEDYISPYPDIDYSMGPKTIYGDVDVFTVILNDAPADQDDEWGRTEEICLRMFTDEIITIHQALFGYSGILGLQQECNALFSLFVGFGPNYDHPELSVLTLGATGATTLQDGQLALGVGTFLSPDTLSLNGGTFSITIDPVSLLATLSSSFSNTASVLLDVSTPSVTLEIINGVNTTDYIFSSDNFSIPHGVSFSFDEASGNSLSCNSITLNLLNLSTVLSDSQLSLNNGNTILSDGTLSFLNGNPFDNHISGFDLVLGRSSDDSSSFNITVNPATMQSSITASFTPITNLINVFLTLNPRDPTVDLGPFIALDVNGSSYIFYSASFNIPSGQSLILGDAATTILTESSFTINTTYLAENVLSFGPLGSSINFSPDSSIIFGIHGVISLAGGGAINLAGGGSINIAGAFNADSSGVWSGDSVLPTSPIKWVRAQHIVSYSNWPHSPSYAPYVTNFSITVINPNAPDPKKCFASIVTAYNPEAGLGAVYPEGPTTFKTYYYNNGSGDYRMNLNVFGTNDIATTASDITLNILLFYTD